MGLYLSCSGETIDPLSILASSHLNQAFETDYPKLVKIFSELLAQVEQLHKQSEPESQSVASFVNLQATTKPSPMTKEESLLKALAQFEKVYSARSFARLSDTVNQLFASPSRSVPFDDEILSLVKMLSRY